jgi:hypothetical protein
MTSLRFGRAFNKASDDLASKLAWSANQNQDGSPFRARSSLIASGQTDRSIASRLSNRQRENPPEAENSGGLT